LPFDFYYLINHTRKWNKDTRPTPDNLHWVPYFEEGKYDLAIMHIDQQCLLPKLGKSKLFQDVYEHIKGKIPIIVINHGTPVYPEMFMQLAAAKGYDYTEEGSMAWAKDEMKKKLVDADAIVCNSHQAQKDWGVGQAIIHGLDEGDYLDLTKEPRITTFISPAGIGEKYYGRKLFHATREVLKEKYGMELMWITQDVEFKNWEEYKEFLGKSLVYFNPTLGSPMPRSRTEAMFSGCCIVTTPYYDADSFIVDGENGFLCKNNPEDAAKKIAWCMNNYREAVKIGQKGKETAQKLFSGERFRQDWITLIEKVLKRKVV